LPEIDFRWVKSEEMEFVVTHCEYFREAIRLVRESAWSVKDMTRTSCGAWMSTGSVLCAAAMGPIPIGRRSSWGCCTSSQGYVGMCVAK
jgi:hypothetical protein